MDLKERQKLAWEHTQEHAAHFKCNLILSMMNIERLLGEAAMKEILEDQWEPYLSLKEELPASSS